MHDRMLDPFELQVFEGDFSRMSSMSWLICLACCNHILAVFGMLSISGPRRSALVESVSSFTLSMFSHRILQRMSCSFWSTSMIFF
uniref:Uncharacterized protein n=1 Tax=Oryza brachyantha TaxID=4533 RepID=J3MT33_ORYBR